MAQAEEQSSGDEDLDLALALSLSSLDISAIRDCLSDREKRIRINEFARRGDVTCKELELLDPTPDLWLLFTLFDQRWFRGRLTRDRVTFKWSQRMKSASGYTDYDNKKCTITLSKPLLTLRPRRDLVETLLHEMIHANLFLIGEDDDDLHHGPQFQKWMDRINREGGCNITVYHDFEEEVDHLKIHVWLCDKECGEVVKRLLNRAPGISEAWFRRHGIECGGIFSKVSPHDPRVPHPEKGKQEDKFVD